MSKLIKGTEMDYNDIPYVNKSTLWEMRKSPLHYLHLVTDTPRKDTPAMKFGRAVHSRILTPGSFYDEFVVAPSVDRRTKEGKAIWAELMDSGKEVISQEDMEMLLAMETEFRMSLWQDLTADGVETEVPLTWTDDDTGVDCKGRIDALTKDYVIDYKTTYDASTTGFQREALKYGYDLQAAMYLDAARANGYDPKGFIFIAQEKNAPYLINIIHAGDAFIDRGNWIKRDLLTKFKQCRDADEWPGYGENELILNEWEAMTDE